MTEDKSGPRRSQLAQGRSRDTRQAIVKAALELWGERGFDVGVDETTAEEIAARAGVAKATFYYHFARKEDVLLATSWLTAKVFYEDVLKALIQGGSTDEVLDDVTVKLSRRIEKVPRSALRRMMQVMSDGAERRDDGEQLRFQRGFAVILLQGQQNGDVPQTLTPADLGMMFEVMLMSSIRAWAYQDDFRLLDVLRRRFAVLLAGARGVTEDALAGGGSESAGLRGAAG
ncbi:TetR/AcrR family transcriptional regulator [Yinghuangia sp. ASG 101]|uniref:TetR/AcrR family transcriptional regulator n=1 Tax=Yinghuangia sp. ASG 101 TaxID=2896848 RepID=UPI001E32BAAD|nr:TetR/AcrR family transcriptional regulator [Yinghuangia sp. ASG 101]UGQ12587.1 TetR/AcrR family transcriptional regulator [Yinghuangia sp. ASG 101]